MSKFYNIKQIKNVIITHKTPILYSGSSMLKVLATMISSIIIAKYMLPADLGLWAIISLALTYSLFLQAGLINGLNLELPHAYGRSENEYAEKMAGVVQAFSVFISMLVLVVGFICFLCLYNYDSKIKYGVLAISVIIALTFYQSYLTSTFRSNNSFLKLSIIQIIDACVNILSLGLIVYSAYNGLIIRAVLILFIFVLLLHIFRPIKVAFLWDKAIFFKLLKVGIPIFILAYIESIALTSDKLWLTKYSTISNVGLYVFSLYALNLLATFSASVANYIYPRMSYDYGKNNDKIQLWKNAKKITLAISMIQFPFVIIGYFFIPFAITRYFPNYLLSIKSMQILLIAGYFKGCTVGANALTSTRNWKCLSIVIIIYAVLLFVLTYAGVNLFDNKMVGVACGILTANIINVFFSVYFTYKALLKKVINDENVS